MDSGVQQKSSHDKVFDIIFKEDELNWKDLIYDLVKHEGMDPWDINVSLLAERFLVMLSKLKELDFRVSGKMVLASSLLLKIKSDRLLVEGIQNLNRLINGAEEEFLDEGFEYEQSTLQQFNEQRIIPRAPQPRERKVSVFDLVDALEHALETDAKRQRVLARTPDDVEVTIPTSTFDLSKSMDNIQGSLKKMFTKSKTHIYFSDLVKSDSKQDMVYTFLPLLHLDNQQKVDLQQHEHFGPIEVVVFNKRL